MTVDTQKPILTAPHLSSKANSNSNSIYKKYFQLGLFINMVMIGLFLACHLYHTQHFFQFLNTGCTALFMLGYMFCLVYFISILFIRKKLKRENKNGLFIGLFALSVSAFSFSAYTLNFSIPLFAKFTTWANMVILILHCCLFCIAFHRKISKPFKIVVAFLIGVSVIFSIYQALYLLPVYVIGLVGSMVVGVGTHLFVPIIITFFFILYYVYDLSHQKSTRFAFYAGLIIPVLMGSFMLSKWSKTATLIYETHTNLIIKPSTELPNWVHLSQQWENNWIGKRILGSSIIYQEELDNFNNMRRNSFGEQLVHDPLVIVANLLFRNIDISQQDRVKILESQFDSRHKAHRKLWSGKNLSTQSVLTNTKVYPQYRMAYVEKIITIKNNSNSNWNMQEEALYTFHVPEGAVATSLSLWVNGIEEKSRLTTKGKADNAYTKIVGVERRDPALLHWQEGNRLTVTVFPCTPSENRVFKIGFTIPLIEEGEQLVLQNVYFEGPPINQAKETAVLEFESTNENIQLPDGYKLFENNKYKRNGKYKAYWELTMDKPKLANSTFQFNNNSYQVDALKTQLVDFKANAIYLDINAEWTNKELQQVFQLFKGRDIYAFDEEKIKLENYNNPAIQNNLLQKRFSLFPFHKIEEEANVLIISKSAQASPNLSDLKDSKFQKNLKQFLSTSKAEFNLFHIGENWSPYLKTLKQFNVFNGQSGGLAELEAMTIKNQFKQNMLGKNEVAVEAAGITISKNANEKDIQAASFAPDHLMRLFNYNSILKQIGHKYFDALNYETGPLIDLAEAAFVVSPISSMIVLETQKDYDRFDIDKSKNSLQNASTLNSGAVPEPSEWFLILLSLLLIVFLTLRQYSVKSLQSQ